MSKAQPKIKLFIVDDSAYVRNFLKTNLKESFDIIGEAGDGVAAVKEIISKRPDVVLLDLMMPKMNGNEVAKAVMSVCPTPIIILTSLTNEEIKQSYELLENSVTEIIKKPEEFDSEFIDKLQKKLKVVSRLKVYKISEKSFQYAGVHRDKIQKGHILTIGASTGGPKTLRNIIGDITSIANLPVILVQHMEKGFEEGYLSWMSELSLKETLLLNQKLYLQDALYICSTDKNINIENVAGKWQFIPEPLLPNQLYFPSVSILLKNIAPEFGQKHIHIQLTGLGDDGREGVIFAKKFGSKIICQSPETAIAPSMPKAVEEFADYILNSEDICSKVIEVIKET